MADGVREEWERGWLGAGAEQGSLLHRKGLFRFGAGCELQAAVSLAAVSPFGELARLCDRRRKQGRSCKGFDAALPFLPCQVNAAGWVMSFYLLPCSVSKESAKCVSIFYREDLGPREGKQGAC